MASRSGQGCAPRSGSAAAAGVHDLAVFVAVDDPAISCKPAMPCARGAGSIPPASVRPRRRRRCPRRRPDTPRRSRRLRPAEDDAAAQLTKSGRIARPAAGHQVGVDADERRLGDGASVAEGVPRSESGVEDLDVETARFQVRGGRASRTSGRASSPCARVHLRRGSSRGSGGGLMGSVRLVLPAPRPRTRSWTRRSRREDGDGRNRP